MSIKGVKIFADVLSIMQEERNKLLHMSTKFHMDSKSAQQDLLLGQLLDEAKDAIKDKFCKITMEKI